MGRRFQGGREVGGDMTMRRVNFGKAAAGAQGVDVALREDGAEPGFEGAASVEIAKEGAAVGGSGETVQVGKKRVGEFTGCGRVWRTAENGGSGGAQVAAEGGNEMIPCGGAALRASAGEGEILQVQCGEILSELRGLRLLGEVFSSAAFESGGKNIERNIPGGGE